MTLKSHNNQIQDLPFIKSFAGHETFPFRYSWLKKGVDWINQDPGIFQREDAVVRFGVGKNMVQSIRYWCLATRIAEETADHKGLQTTKLGTKIFSDDGWDPYLEDDATLWLLHWNLASRGTRAATWYWAFNRFTEFIFSRFSLIEALVKEIQNLNLSNVSESTIKRDIGCFILTYLSGSVDKSDIENSLRCPLIGLELLLQEPDGERMRFNVGPKSSLPPEIFAFTLFQFWNQRNQSGTTLELREILRTEGSPALIFKLDQDSILVYLDQLEQVTSGKIIFQDTPLVRQVVKKDNSVNDSLFILENYYGAK